MAWLREERKKGHIKYPFFFFFKQIFITAPFLEQSGTQHFLWTAKSVNDRFPPKVYCYNQIITLHANTFGEKQDRE